MREGDINDKNYLYKELSYQIVGMCMEIHSEYGHFHNERIYHKALEEKLEINKLSFLSKPRIVIYSKETGKENLRKSAKEFCANLGNKNV